MGSRADNKPWEAQLEADSMIAFVVSLSPRPRQPVCVIPPWCVGSVLRVVSQLRIGWQIGETFLGAASSTAPGPSFPIGPRDNAARSLCRSSLRPPPHPHHTNALTP